SNQTKLIKEARAHYQTLTNMELIALLLQREAELRKLKVQVRDLEDYIDKLLVRIMEQTPTLLQVRARPK
uniref:FIP-RBD domain-containing protein n=1 Tax=Electrophorus electricus TaxID=8005 RepID=A0A4W4HD38_ELEEL